MNAADADRRADFAILHRDGRVEYGRLGAGESIVDALRARISDMETQGMGPLRAYFTSDFGGLHPNPLADRVFSSVGYRHPTGWCGTVAVTMEEDDTGTCPPLTAEARATLDELAATGPGPTSHARGQDFPPRWREHHRGHGRE